MCQKCSGNRFVVIFYSLPFLRYQTMDAGYDYDPIYEQVHQTGQQSEIAYNKRNEGEPTGFDKHFAPTCFREHSYRYDSFDAKYETLKYTRPKECNDCPLANEGICQKVYKVKITQDLRRYTDQLEGLRLGKPSSNAELQLNVLMHISRNSLSLTMFVIVLANALKFILA